MGCIWQQDQVMTADNTYDDNLDAAFAHAWQVLARAVADRRHGLRIRSWQR